MDNTLPNTTSNYNTSAIYCTDELQVTGILHQSAISPEERTITSALSVTTEDIAVETNPDVSAE